MKRVAVLASGRGTNLAALMAAQSEASGYEVVLAVSNLERSPALELARAAGVEAVGYPSRAMTRDDHERGLLQLLAARGVEMICLAGYMRILSPAFVAAFPGPILNVHPSLLPSFPGMHAQRQAIESGVQWTGATIHFVDAGLDTGPIIMQEPVPVLPGDTEASLSRRILATEHSIFPRATALVARGQVEIQGRHVRLRGSTPNPHHNE